jgi:hypothetical protein
MYVKFKVQMCTTYKILEIHPVFLLLKFMYIGIQSIKKKTKKINKFHILSKFLVENCSSELQIIIQVKIFFSIKFGNRN